MKKSSLSRAVLIASALMLAPLGATQAQSAAPAPAPVSVTPAPAASFDMNRVFIVTAGIIGGAVVASAVTSGFIMPLYCWVTGSTAAAEMGMAAGAAMENGAGMGMGAGAAMENGAGMWAIRNAMATLGAVGGGFYADTVYQNQ